MAKLSQRAFADMYHVSVDFIRKMKADNVDLTNRQKVSRYILRQPKRPAKWTSGNPLNRNVGKVENTADEVDEDASLDDIQEALRMEMVKAVDYDKARTLKTKADALKKIKELAILDKTYIHREELNQHLIKIGNGVKSALARYRGELPQVMEGMTAPQIKKALAAKEREVLLLLADGLSEIYEEEEVEND